MPITYPLALPTTKAPANMVWGGESVVASVRSPFTGEVEVQQHDGQFWHGTLNYPPMARADAEEMISFLQKLDGQYGTFTMTPPAAATPRGTASGTPLVAGGSQTGVDLDTDGWDPGETVLREGDFIQLGSGLTSRLYKCLDDATSDGSGAATLTLWPRLRSSTSPDDNATIVTSSPAGLFRLTANRTEWTVMRVEKYGLSFSFRSEP